MGLGRDPGSLPAHDLILLCDLADPQGTFDKLSGQFGVEAIRAPALLKISVPSDPPESKK